MSTSTTVASGSNAVNVNTFAGSGTLHVVQTATFAAATASAPRTVIVYLTNPGTHLAPTYQTITYTGTSGGNAFTGCTCSGSGLLHTGDTVFQDGYTVQDDGQKKRTPGNGVQGIPGGTYGSYDLVQITSPDSDEGATNYNRTNPALANGTGTIFTRYYKMVGYYSTGAVYETFIITGAPATGTTTNPNTGHTLINTFVASFWEV